MRKTEQKVISSKTYTVTQLGATDGRSVMVRLAKVFKGIASKDPIQGILEGLNDEDLDFICKKFAPLTTVDLGKGKPALSDVFEEHFAGDYLSMFQWLAFCVEVNYGPFLSGLGVKMAALEPLVKASLSDSTNLSTGPSGA